MNNQEIRANQVFFSGMPRNCPSTSSGRAAGIVPWGVTAKLAQWGVIHHA